MSTSGKRALIVFFAFGLSAGTTLAALAAFAETSQVAYFLKASGRINNHSERQNIGASFRGIKTDDSIDTKSSVSGFLASVPGTRLAESGILGYYPANVVLRDGVSGSEDRTYVKVRRRFLNVGVYSGSIRLRKALKPYQPGRQRFRGRGVLRS